ncbi:secreted protein [Melampsora americana]|nr:secreted protein [Melampsora americana]
MSLIKFLAALLTLVVFEALVMVEVNAAVAQDMLPVNHVLARRDLPPCKQNWPSEQAPTEKQRTYDLNVDIKATKGPGWRPTVCSKPFWNCVYVQDGNVSNPKGGFSLAAVFPLDDGTHVEVYRYWQSTIQWTTNGGTVNSYMAHGVDYVCVKGIMVVQFMSSGKKLIGNPKTPDEFVCECHYPLDDDKRITIG